MSIRCGSCGKAIPAAAGRCPFCFADKPAPGAPKAKKGASGATPPEAGAASVEERQTEIDERDSPHVVLESGRWMVGSVLVDFKAGQEFTDPVQIQQLIGIGVPLAPATRMTGHVHCPECGNIFRPEESAAMPRAVSATGARPAILG